MRNPLPPIFSWGANLSLYQWSSASYLHQAIGILAPLRRGSFLIQWADPIAALLVGLLFLLGPFVSTALIGVLLLACGAYWVLVTLADDDQSGFTPVHLLILLYWGINTVATAMSPVKKAAFVGWTKLTLYLLLFALMTRVLRSPKLRSFVIALYLHAATFVSIYGIRQWRFGADALATWTDPNSAMAKVTRVYSYLGNPNLLAAYLLPAIFLGVAAIFAWRGWVPKALAVTMTLVNTLCLVLTYSRGGWIGLVVGGFTLILLLVYWGSVKLPEAWQKWAMPVVLGTTAGVILLALLFVEPVRDRAASMLVGRQDSSNNFRMNVWDAVFEMIRDRPVIGIGPGNTAFNQIYPLYMRPKYTALSAYSVPLEIAVETGFIGLSAFVGLIFVLLSQGVAQIQHLREKASGQGYWLIAAIAIILGMMAHGAFDTVWYRPQVNMLWWLAVALVASYYTVPYPKSTAIDEQR
ncbi:IctB family putative bicarbonate transporter [Laspinema olomoucense]|uniref:IctB family putative bicarbonate transporter n=1 Tax=Laspinema olomoucense TaxID=3231600 RepID=UPI0021BA5C62|nr:MULTISPECIES: IctB family putative bicarbonate transporter [unclassified Laspinema]MCT7972444.1 IctB family putative bicarbonate transporter [Laspinema sp. D3d]MCT7994306.1 IctB family putative bicarbonate transporter [Laspinema sp. D3c]